MAPCSLVINKPVAFLEALAHKPIFPVLRSKHGKLRRYSDSLNSVIVDARSRFDRHWEWSSRCLHGFALAPARAGLGAANDLAR